MNLASEKIVKEPPFIFNYDLICLTDLKSGAVLSLYRVCSDKNVSTRFIFLN